MGVAEVQHRSHDHAVEFVGCVLCRCPPCRRFTPVFASWYRQMKEAKRLDVEVLFVSADNSEREFRGAPVYIHGVQAFAVLDPSVAVVTADRCRLLLIGM